MAKKDKDGIYNLRPTFELYFVEETEILEDTVRKR